ncbi:ThuA domain-containing protein [Flavobacterium ginsenosidimutans]|uniref:ThuA domain-containing protein n=1 Tax=Flavobacterium ginsenosidimutans TaxID=687844 RepID=UPI000DAE6E14|nr:ThuA domain-containing protein [Flavobacterium ginsenosidimutans]KAF2337553.1 ThuA domain-containing protein [Flavobacterium ginsenosidimutans]
MTIFNQNHQTIFKKSILLLALIVSFFGFSQNKKEHSKFKVIAFYTAKNDQAHISFVHEANKYFPKLAAENHFQYDSTSNWDNLNAKFLAKYQVVLFLDTRPEKKEQREAFQKYMENGGGFIGFHFSAFALNDSSYPQDWNWYHNTFLGSGEYGSNTWKPTSAVLRVENQHSVTKNLPAKFTSAPNEWYRWSNDLTKNPDIEILLAIDESSFPLGTGPKAHEIWHSGYYPVVWTNKKYKMLYVNMGHNDIDYEGGTNKTLSYTFENKTQSQLILNALLWLGNSKKK